MYNLLEKQYESDSMTNITSGVVGKMSMKLLNDRASPLSQLWTRIQTSFEELWPNQFSFHQNDNPIVSVKQNFDELLIPHHHPSRSRNESYYLNRHLMLRTHMTAHERELMRQGFKRFLIAGDVYRRDEIDRTHFPAFHQVEGVSILSLKELSNHSANFLHNSADANVIKLIDKACEAGQLEHDDRGLLKMALLDLHSKIDGLLRKLFGNVDIRWQETYFPFTQPSLEAEVFYKDRWVEVLGCGILKTSIVQAPLQEDGKIDHIAWAFGIGLERIAMILHDIPDIRLFWSHDRRFKDQFVGGNNSLHPSGHPVKFVPFSKYPPINRDISFFIPSQSDFHPNNLYEIVREIASDLVEDVKLVMGP